MLRVFAHHAELLCRRYDVLWPFPDLDVLHRNTYPIVIQCIGFLFVAESLHPGEQLSIHHPLSPVTQTRQQVAGRR